MFSYSFLLLPIIFFHALENLIFMLNAELFLLFIMQILVWGQTYFRVVVGCVNWIQQTLVNIKRLEARQCSGEKCYIHFQFYWNINAFKNVLFLKISKEIIRLFRVFIKILLNFLLLKFSLNLQTKAWQKIFRKNLLKMSN